MSTPIEPTIELPRDENPVGAERGDIGAGSGQRADHGDDRLLGRQPAQFVVENSSAPVVVPPGLSIDRTTAMALELPMSRISFSVASSPVISPPIASRAICGLATRGPADPPSASRAR